PLAGPRPWCRVHHNCGVHGPFHCYERVDASQPATPRPCPRRRGRHTSAPAPARGRPPPASLPRRAAVRSRARPEAGADTWGLLSPCTPRCVTPAPHARPAGARPSPGTVLRRYAGLGAAVSRAFAAGKELTDPPVLRRHAQSVLDA